jgi:molecular chaperone IbpA
MTKLVKNNSNLAGRWLQMPNLFTEDVFDELEKAMSAFDWFNPEFGSLSLKGFPKGDAFVNKEGKYVIELLLAGYSKDDLSVEIDGDLLKVSATKAEGEDSDGPRTLARRAFSKSYLLNSNWDLQSAEVSHKDGVLRIVVPPVTTQPTAVKKLEIK